jgi:hypothetical protein
MTRTPPLEHNILVGALDEKGVRKLDASELSLLAYVSHIRRFSATQECRNSKEVDSLLRHRTEELKRRRMMENLNNKSNRVRELQLQGMWVFFLVVCAAKRSLICFLNQNCRWSGWPTLKRNC